MAAIERSSLLTLEAYARERNALRAQVIEHKKHRTVQLGENVTVIFEDALTVRYQIQEMLRVERIFEERGIQAELDAYNPLVPDGRNFKATMMLEYPDPGERALRLSQLIGIEDKVWIQVGSGERIWAVADEDLDRETEQKTSSVHFLRFELDEARAALIKRCAALTLGIEHPGYQAKSVLPGEVRDALARDLA